MTMRRVLGVALPFVLSFGCASSQAERVQSARLAEIDEQTRARVAAIDERQQAHDERIEQVADAREERVENADRPGAEQRGELVEVASERAQYRNQAQGRLEKLAARLQGVSEKADVLGGRAPTSLHEDLETARAEQSLLRQRISALQNGTPSTWAEEREALDAQLDRLDRRIDALNEKISGV